MLTNPEVRAVPFTVANRMITISVCTSTDCDTLAGLWNAKTLDEQSCWYQAPTVSSSYLAMLMSSGFVFQLASDDSTAVGFGLWRGPADAPNLTALAADDDDVYYRLMAAFCAWAVAGGATTGWAEIGAASTTEKSRMDALGVIDYTPSGYVPLAPDGDPNERVVAEYRATADLSALAGKLAEVLGGES